MAISLKGLPPAFLLFTACSFWGVATVLNKALLGSISPVLLLFLQLLASAIFLWAACIHSGNPCRKERFFLSRLRSGS